MVQDQEGPRMRIGELARHADVRISTIRYWERRGILPPGARGVRGQRRYDAAALDRLAFVRLAQQGGLTLAEIRGLLHGFPAATTAPSRWRSVRAAKLAAIDDRIRALRAARRRLGATVSCRCADLDECGRRARRTDRRS
jgi:MerR family transcriptional regulator, redox-sensitive transcriptional activator SoxR